MAFFNKMGETISSKSKEVVKKAKDMAEISSLNGQINSQEEIINKTYFEIGKSYFELHKDSADDKYTVQCDTIKATLDKIQQLKSDINKIRGAQICPSCGAEIADGIAFCSSCGIKITVIESADTYTQTEEVIVYDFPQEMPKAADVKTADDKKCPSCGFTVETESLFCQSCGQKLS